MTARHVLAVDQGTTSTRSIVFDDQARIVATAQAEFAQHYPREGWVEHDAEDIWRDTLSTLRNALAAARLSAADIAAIGITNQRETIVLWDRATGTPLHNAIVWQDRRTAPICARLRDEGHEDLVRARTGLLLDPYFSATKLGWLLDHVDGARARAQAGELAAGTIDSFLLWRLTEGRVHATDATNASRTALFDIHAQAWCPELLGLFDIPAAILPEVRDCAGPFGETTLLGPAIPIAGIAGDQHAALFGQACFARGDAKATYGTGCFMLLNTGAEAVASKHRLLTTMGYRLGGKPTYAVEGAIFIAGAAIQWLRDGLGLVDHAAETEALAAGLSDNGGVYMVPAFVGLGAPHWDPHARGLIAGLTLGSTAAHIARAALEAVAYQSADLVDAALADGATPIASLRIDGGMMANDWLAQFLADMLGVAIERPADLESTARGAAMLAGLGVGLWPDQAVLAALPREIARFEPAMDTAARNAARAGWAAALARALRDAG